MFELICRELQCKGFRANAPRQLHHCDKDAAAQRVLCAHAPAADHVFQHMEHRLPTRVNELIQETHQQYLRMDEEQQAEAFVRIGAIMKTHFDSLDSTELAEVHAPCAKHQTQCLPELRLSIEAHLQWPRFA